MRVQPKNNCPMNKFEPCKELECAWFLRLQGNNPNTGQQVDDWGCAVAWIPLLTIENSQMQRQTGAAVESFRNEMVKANEVSQQVLLAAAASNNPDLKVLKVTQ